jgi:hypothetical protein
LFLDRDCISKPVKCFLSQNGQRGSLLVFYVGNILDDKNTLCNGYIFYRMIDVYSESSCIQKMFKSKLVTDQKLLEDVHENSLQNSKPNQPVPVQPSG